MIFWAVLQIYGENMKTNWKLFIILLIASIFGDNSCISLHFDIRGECTPELTGTFIRVFNRSNHTDYNYVCYCYSYWSFPR